MIYRAFIPVILTLTSWPAWSWFPNQVNLASGVEYGEMDVEQITLDDQPFHLLTTSSSIHINEPGGGTANSTSNGSALAAASNISLSSTAAGVNSINARATGSYNLLTQITASSDFIPLGQSFNLLGRALVFGGTVPAFTGNGSGGGRQYAFLSKGDGSYNAFGVEAIYSRGAVIYDQLTTYIDNEKLYDGGGAATFFEVLDFLLPVVNGEPIDIQLSVGLSSGAGNDAYYATGSGSVVAGISILWGGFYEAVLLGDSGSFARHGFSQQSDSIEFTVTDPSGFDWKQNYITPIPEPSAGPMMLIGLTGVIALWRSQTRRRATRACLSTLVCGASGAALY